MRLFSRPAYIALFISLMLVGLASPCYGYSSGPVAYDRYLYPVVRVIDTVGSGSGVVISSEGTRDGWSSYILTAAHVAENAFRSDGEILIQLYSSYTKYDLLDAEVVSCGEVADIALIHLLSDQKPRGVAKLMPPNHIEKVKVFDDVVSVGGGLGKRPFPTFGQLAGIDTLTAYVYGKDDVHYWLVNSPIIYGNSGGATFLTDTGELLGITVGVFAAKKLPVPHMTLIVPVPTIYSWLESEGYSDLIPEDDSLHTWERDNGSGI